MPFKVMDVKGTIAEGKKDKDFDFEYKKIKQEYKLIEKLVETRKAKSMTQDQITISPK